MIFLLVFSRNLSSNEVFEPFRLPNVISPHKTLSSVFRPPHQPQTTKSNRSSTHLTRDDDITVISCLCTGRLSFHFWKKFNNTHKVGIWGKSVSITVVLLALAWQQCVCVCVRCLTKPLSIFYNHLGAVWRVDKLIKECVCAGKIICYQPIARLICAIDLYHLWMERVHLCSRLSNWLISIVSMKAFN